MSGAYCGEGSADPKDAFVMAETARLRELPAIYHKSDLVRSPGLLAGYRADLIADRGADDQPATGRADQRFPSRRAEVRLLIRQGRRDHAHRYASSGQPRRTGQARLASWLQQRHVRGYASLAAPG
jgi:hypothetical protein